MAAAGAGLAAGSGLLQLGAAYGQSKSLEAQGEYQKQQYDFNAKLSDFQGEDAIKRGDVSADQIKKKGAQVAGAQKAALAAQGIDIGSGTAAAALEDTREMTDQDVMTAKNNAWREAWGYRVSAATSTAQGDEALLASRNASRNTLLTGGIQAIGAGVQAANMAGAFKPSGSSRAVVPSGAWKTGFSSDGSY